MNNFKLSFILLLIAGIQIFPQWTVKSPKGIRDRLCQIRAADESHIIVSTNSKILTTNDSGENWKKPDPNSSYPVAGLIAIAGKDYIAGSVIKNYLNGDLNHFAGMKSLDFGYSWLPVQGVYGDIKSLSFLNDSIGYIAGSKGKFCKTNDGGFTWNNILCDLSTSININTVFFLNDSLGWIAANGILRTTDGGLHWSKPELAYLTIKDVYFFNKDSGWMFTDDLLIRTTDGGNSWMGLNTGTGTDTLKRIVFVNQNLGYLLTNKNFFRTTDSGSNWEKMELPVVVSAMNDMTLAEDNSIWICGDQGLILKFDSTFIENDSTESDTIKPPLTPDYYFLAQNYPNPFNPATTIRYSIPAEEFVTLKIYNTLGKEIAVLVDEMKEAGNYTAIFNPAGLSSGIYIYELRAGSYTQSRKMILLR